MFILKWEYDYCTHRKLYNWWLSVKSLKSTQNNYLSEHGKRKKYKVDKSISCSTITSFSMWANYKGKKKWLPLQKRILKMGNDLTCAFSALLSIYCSDKIFKLKKKKQKTKNKATNRSRTAKTTTKSTHKASHLQGLEMAELWGTQMISDEEAGDTSSFRWIVWVWWQQHTQIFFRKCLKRRQATVAKSRTPIPEMEFLCECVFLFSGSAMCSSLGPHGP